MGAEFVRVDNYVKPSKWHWFKAALWSVVTLRFFIDLFRLLEYYTVNCIVGRQQAVIGKDCKIHPTVMLRQPERIRIGNHCSINHNNVFQAGKRTGTITLGNNVLTAANVMFVAYTHSFDTPDVPIMDQDCYDAPIVVEDDVWIRRYYIGRSDYRKGRSGRSRGGCQERCSCLCYCRWRSGPGVENA